MIQQRFSPMTREDSFYFSCSPSVPCFNDCCRDLNQFLTPYDIIRLKTCLDLSSTDFLAAYTTCHTGPETGLPVIAFKTDPARNHICPFVTDAGCSVYSDRPSSCRMYPLARAAARSRETGQFREYFALLREPHCQGHCRQNRYTVNAWIETQELAPYNRFNDLMLNLFQRKNQLRPGPLDAEAGRRFRLALYDPDAFRESAFDNGFFKQLSIDRTTYERSRQDDTALLQVGINWLAETLFRL